MLVVAIEQKSQYGKRLKSLVLLLVVPGEQSPPGLRLDFSDTDNLAAGAINPLNLRSHLTSRNDVFSAADPAGAVEFGTSYDNFEPFFGTRANDGSS
jgi:hypothetical protein